MTHTGFSRTFILAGLLAAQPALGSEESGGGLPQMDVSTYPSQLFWLFVSFTALYLLMSKLALPRVTSVLEMRQAQKNGNLEKAGDLNEEAKKVKAAYEKSLAQAQATAAAAVAAAERTVGDKISEEQSRFADSSRKRLSAAEQTINKAKAEALQSLADVAAEIAADMTGKIADVQVNKADAKKAVLSVMQKGG